MTGKLGPYEVFSSDRWGPITQGTSNVLRLQNLTETAKDPHLGPGKSYHKYFAICKNDAIKERTSRYLSFVRYFVTLQYILRSG